MKVSARAPAPVRHPAPRETAQVHWTDPQVDDAELVTRALAGDRWARAALYHRYASEIANLALRLVRDEETAADVLQDTFVHALETLPQLREPAKLRWWLRAIAVRQVQRHFRRRRLLRMLRIGRAPAHVPLEDLSTRDASQEARAQLRQIDQALGEAPPRARLLWTLRVVEGETLPSIAEMCGISLATVKRDLALAQELVRQITEPDELDEFDEEDVER